MYSRIFGTTLLILALLLVSTSVSAQDIPSSCKVYESLAAQIEQVTPGHVRFREKVEITCEGFKFFADHVEIFSEENRLLATGNVLFTTPDTRITASKLEFNLKDKTGVFYDATGSSKVKPQTGTKSMFGTQEADMHFRGEKLEKLAERKYRLTNGGFTTCLQPTARWEFTSGSVTINLDNYAVARNTVFRVKGVPLLYLPIIYYPLDDDDRATGFLLPSYGNSFIHGQTIRNAFFWAIHRSADLTLMHDWFSKTGQAYGGEFRYAAGEGSGGNVTASFVNEKESVTVFPDGSTFTRQAGRNYQVQGAVVQQLPGRFRLGADARYFSDLNVEQLYHYNPYDLTNRQTYINGNISGQLGGLQIGAAYSRREYFYSSASSSLTGASPRVTISRPEQMLGRIPVYWGFNLDGIGIISQSVSGDVVTDRGRRRVDFTPSVRVPLTRLTWLNLATTATWHSTWWSRSIDPVSGAILEEPLTRRYFEMQASATGPVFSRVFQTPGSGFAQRWKHVIEPAITLSRTSAIDVRDRILTDYDTTDFAVGGVTRLNYSLANRLYTKRGEGALGVVRELASIVIAQSYYANPELAAKDQFARNPSLLYLPESNFSTVAIAARVTPADGVSFDFRTDYEKMTNTFRNLSAGAALKIGTYTDLNAAWSKSRQPKDSPYAESPYYNNQSFNSGLTLRSEQNIYGGSYRLNYDIHNSAFINQNFTAYYNPQCCGIAIEYARSNLPSYGGLQGKVYDRRFNISFTLAGIGSFSDFFGAFGADPYRR
ncbi:MAG: putative LPS assembly protein LptD [Vicinamibacterales bacterium]